MLGSTFAYLLFAYLLSLGHAQLINAFPFLCLPAGGVHKVWEPPNSPWCSSYWKWGQKSASSCCSLISVRVAGGPWEEKAPSVPGVKINVLQNFPAVPPSPLELLASIKNINEIVLVYSGCPLTANPVKIKRTCCTLLGSKIYLEGLCQGQAEMRLFELILWRVARRGQKCGLWALCSLFFKLFLCLWESNTTVTPTTLGFFLEAHWQMLSAFLKHRTVSLCVCLGAGVGHCWAQSFCWWEVSAQLSFLKSV